MNKVILTGRFTKDPESRMGANNIETAIFRLACDNGFTDKNGNRDTEFIEVIAFNKSAEIINKYCKKGSFISVQGRIKNTSYEKDGVKKYSTRVILESLEFLSSSKTGENGSSASKPVAEENPYVANETVDNGFEIGPDDLPF